MSPIDLRSGSVAPSAVQSLGLKVALSVTYPLELPIVEKREAIIAAIQREQVLVVVGETGSGKSTQLPKMCLEAGRGVQGLIGCTQPRRIAAVTLAARVSEELRDAGGSLVGHKIRFQDRTCRNTRIKFMTDGILLAEVQRDRAFKSYDTIIVDEAHERTLNIDFLLGLLKRVLPRRPDLKVIITSATIDPEKFSRAFDGAPIIEVSGRMYPVEVRYRPQETTDGDGDDGTTVDQAVEAVGTLRSGPGGGGRGDILVFMPTESDIRETVQRLEEKRFFNTVVLPLFGRMVAGDQQRVFRATTEDKIIVATNVAETSVTIPGIRYVVDTGLARVAHYNARSRTQGLPVVRVSQASADQRKGRCGRVEAGVCVRLYSKEDYQSRPLYTPPEIQRSNLAEVILRMLFLRLGNVQEFPFLDPPSPAAVKDGFGVLRELGAVDDHRRLTSLGRIMARLPLDPRLSRMLLEARREGCLHEMVILAAALSVQDPRERPLEQEAAADQAHAAFRDLRSDFVGLLKLWKACWIDPSWTGSPSEGPRSGASESPSESQPPPREADDARYSATPLREDLPTSALRPPPPAPRLPSSVPSRVSVRAFCRKHFLSYRRMREWRDVYEEILSMLDEFGGFALNGKPGGYDQVHRSIVSGYLSHIGMRREKNLYLAAKNRQVMIFPGSGLFNRGGAWIVASEMVQTSRLFARTVANVEPEWLESLGRHLCRSTTFEPHWEKNRGQVTAYERVILYGLPIVDRRKVAYDRVRPAEAREIFIRSALVEGELPGRHEFLEHNRELIRRIEELESRTRRRDLLVDDEAQFRFYDGRLPAFADVRSLDRFIREQGGDEVLRMKEEDLLRSAPDFDELSRFPDALQWGGGELPLRYAFEPGSEEDGVTVKIPVHALSRLRGDPFEWMVPGLLEEKVTTLLRGLPKHVRKQLVPVAETARRIVERLDFRRGSLHDALARIIEDLTGARVTPDMWEQVDVPAHLRMRFEILGPDGEILGTGRGFEELSVLASRRHEDEIWEKARRDWERDGLKSWDFGDLPRQIELGRDSMGLGRHACLGLSAESRGVAVRLFPDPGSAMTATRAGLMLLYEFAFGAELRQVMRGCALPGNKASMIFFMGTCDEAATLLQLYVKQELFDLREPQWPDRSVFEATVAGLRGRLHSAAREILDEVLVAVQERDAARRSILRFHQMAGREKTIQERMEILLREIEALMPADFLTLYRRPRIQQLPRYLRALGLRGERAYADPGKDRIKAKLVAHHEERAARLKTEVEKRYEERALLFLDEYRWMIEEFKISVFAPEIRTLFRVSEKRLDEKWREWETGKQTMR